ncbi:MAG TPA: hypothetical protein VJV78_11355 [Polyangiales bacterium]|nr:hypothetical protein [Polyangiales bacterium]
MKTPAFAWLGLVLLACAGSHSGDDGTAGSGVAGKDRNGAGSTSWSDNPAGSGAVGAGSGASAAAGRAGKGGAGGDACKRTPAKHRAAAEMCDRERSASSEPSPQPSTGCTSDAECTQGTNGRCGPNNRGVRSCNYDQCFADGECTKGGPCVCAPGGQGNNVCFMGNCQTDADCGANGYCSPSFGSCGNYAGVVAYYCHSCKDECVDDADCSSQGGGYCAYEPTAGYWKCSMSQCVG